MTVETFAAWKEKFTIEMQCTKKVSLKDEATAKLTGTLQPQVLSHSFRVLSLDCMHKSDTLQPTDIAHAIQYAQVVSCGKPVWSPKKTKEKLTMKSNATRRPLPMLQLMITIRRTEPTTMGHLHNNLFTAKGLHLIRCRIIPPRGTCQAATNHPPIAWHKCRRQVYTHFSAPRIPCNRAVAFVLLILPSGVPCLSCCSTLPCPCRVWCCCHSVAVCHQRCRLTRSGDIVVIAAVPLTLFAWLQLMLTLFAKSDVFPHHCVIAVLDMFLSLAGKRFPDLCGYLQYHRGTCCGARCVLLDSNGFLSSCIVHRLHCYACQVLETFRLVCRKLLGSIDTG